MADSPMNVISARGATPDRTERKRARRSRRLSRASPERGRRQSCRKEISPELWSSIVDLDVTEHHFRVAASGTFLRLASMATRQSKAVASNPARPLLS